MVLEIWLKMLKLSYKCQKVTAKMAKSYKKATKMEKGKILDSLQKLTGFNRSYLARRLRIFSFLIEYSFIVSYISSFLIN